MCRQPRAHLHQYQLSLERYLFGVDRRACLLPALAVQAPRRQALLEFVGRWREPILNYVVPRYSSGMVEGLNNKIELLKQLGLGFGNDSDVHLRALMACEGRPVAH